MEVSEAQVSLMGAGGGGDVAKRLLTHGFNTHNLRPWRGNDGRDYVTHSDPGTGTLSARQIVVNDATLRKDEWIMLDRAVIAAAQLRLRAVTDLRSRGLTYNIPNGLGTTVFQSQVQSDISGATISMDGLRRSEGDRPEYDIASLPLPIIHKDFHFTAREIETSRSGGPPLDVTMAQLAGRKVAECVEQILLGVWAGGTFAFGGGSIYGYSNYPNITSYGCHDWTDEVGTTGEEVLEDVLAMKAASIADRHYGPWILYVSTTFGSRLENDYKAGSDKSLLQRVKEIEGIDDVRSVDYLTANTAVLVEMTPETVRIVDALPLQTVQWPTEGGMRLNFKVMTIAVPQIRSDFNERCGIVQATIDSDVS